MADMERVLPEGDGATGGFFEIGNPSAPTIKLQFRTKTDHNNPKLKFEDDKWWEEIVDTSSEDTQEFQNYLFKSVEIEDDGGVQKLKLELTDQNIAELESLLIRTSLADGYANEKANDSAKVNSQQNDSLASGWLRYFVGENANVHIRIRLGYSQDTKSWATSEAINDSMASGTNWSNRKNTPEKTVIMTPWFYFMILNVDVNYSPGIGATALITGASIGNTLLNKFRIIQQYAVLRGTPEKLAKDLFNTIAPGDKKNGSIVSCFTLKNIQYVKFFYADGETKKPFSFGDDTGPLKPFKLKPVYSYKDGDKEVQLSDEKRSIEISLGKTTNYWNIKL